MANSKNRTKILRLEPLEGRSVPATAGFAAGTLTVTPRPGDDVGVSALLFANGDTLPGRLRVTVDGVTIFQTGDDQRVDTLVVQGRDASEYTLAIGSKVVLRKLTVGGAAQATVVTLLGARIAGSVQFTGHSSGTGNDFFTVDSATIDGNLTAALKGGANLMTVDDSTVGGSLSVTAAAGDDMVRLAPTAAVTVLGKATFALGAGTNSIIGQGARTVTVGGDLVYSGVPSTSDVFDLSTYGTSLAVGGAVRVNLRGAVGNWLSGPLTCAEAAVTGGPGNNQVGIAGTLAVTRSLRVSLGNGNNQLTVGGGRVGGEVSYTGGTGDDRVDVGEVAVTRDLKIALGAGSHTQQVNCIPANNLADVVVGGNLTVTGTSATTVTLRRLRLAGDLSVTTGAGTDAVYIDDSDVNGDTRMRLGAGADAVYVETTDAFVLFNAVKFGGSLFVDGGDGDDQVHLWNPGGQRVLVGGNVALIGSGGSDTFAHNAGQNLYLGLKAEDFEVGGF